MDDEKNLSRNEKYEMVIDKLVDFILEGKTLPEQKLFSENQLSKNMGISRAHVRDVYSALSILGIVESRQGEGTFYKSGDSEMAYKILFIMMYMGAITIEDIMEVRKIIEIGVAEKAAINRKSSDVTKMLNCVANMEKCSDSAELSRLDGELHSTIAKSTGNPLLTGLTQVISGYTIRAIKEHWNFIIQDRDSSVKRKTFEQHEDLVNAIVNKKPYIAKAIAQEHLGFVEISLSRYKKEKGQKQ
ncbi:MAG: FCD domain-containing protein [Lachnospiraceae bacterium]|nr:FCD domain-containing protein [Lachnospiraceae bacterium]